MRLRACTEGPPSIVGSIGLSYSVYDQPPHSSRLRGGRSVWILGRSRCNGLSIRAVATDQKICGAPDFPIVQRLLHHKDPANGSYYVGGASTWPKAEGPNVQEAFTAGQVRQGLREGRAGQVRERVLQAHRVDRLRGLGRARERRSWILQGLLACSRCSRREATPRPKITQRYRALFSWMVLPVNN
jgi:hypothetical protein